MTLVEFLTARLDEDEQLAQAAYVGPWVVEVLKPSVLADDDSANVLATDRTRSNWGIAVDSEGYGACSISNATHIARHDPARVLREVEAKRRIIAWVEAQQTPNSTIGDDFVYPLDELAQAYADHPDYREERRW